MSTLHFNILLLVDDFVNLHGWSAVQKKSLCKVVNDRNHFFGRGPILNLEMIKTFGQINTETNQNQHSNKT